MKPIQRLIPLLLAAVLSACSGSREPSEAQARAALEQQIKASSQGCVKLLEFHKFSAQQEGAGGVILVKANAKIEFLEDCVWPSDSQVVATKLVPGATPNVKKGERRSVNLTLRFQKADRGWTAIK